MADGQGFDPTTGSPALPAEYQAIQGEQLSKMGLQDTPTGPFGALARMIAAGRGGGMTQDALSQITQMHQDAFASLARAYGSDDPYGAIANDPAASSYAKWALLNQTPEQVARSKYIFGQSQLQQPEIAAARARLPLILSGIAGAQPSVAGGPAAAGGGAAAGGPAIPTDLPQFPGRMMSTAAGAPGTPAPGAAPTAPPQDDLVAKLPPDPAAGAAYYASLNPTQQFALRNQLRARMQQQLLRVPTIAAVPQPGG